MIKSVEINLVAAALVKAQSEMGNAAKGSANPFFKSKYADLNSIREACLPALFANGLSVMQPTVVIEGKNYIETLVMHESGQYLGGHTEIVFSKANDAQNFGAGTTYARRFGLQSLICIGAEDSDGEEAVGRGKGATKPVTTLTKAADVTLTATEKQNLVVEKASATGAAEDTSLTQAPPKKGGFGVKATKVEVKTVSSGDGWT